MYHYLQELKEYLELINITLSNAGNFADKKLLRKVATVFKFQSNLKFVKKKNSDVMQDLMSRPLQVNMTVKTPPDSELKKKRKPFPLFPANFNKFMRIILNLEPGILQMENSLTELNQLVSSLTDCESGNDIFTALGTYHLFRSNRFFVKTNNDDEMLDKNQTKIIDYFPRTLTMDDAWNLLGLPSEPADQDQPAPVSETPVAEQVAENNQSTETPSANVVPDPAQYVELDATPLVSEMETIVSNYFLPEENMAHIENKSICVVAESQSELGESAVSTSELCTNSLK